jgi:hypothetical protein
MADRTPSGPLSGPGVMLLSAAIFGYFGFSVAWLTTGNNGEFLLYVAILEWTLKVTAIAFLAAALLAFASPLAGNLVYSVVGLLGALALLVVLVLDIADQQHTAISPILLIIFIGWNGYGSWMGLRAALEQQSLHKAEQSGIHPP